MHVMEEAMRPCAPHLSLPKLLLNRRLGLWGPSAGACASPGLKLYATRAEAREISTLRRVPVWGCTFEWIGACAWTGEFARREGNPEDDELEAATEWLRVKERDLQIREPDIQKMPQAVNERGEAMDP